LAFYVNLLPATSSQMVNLVGPLRVGLW
jgi:hypothetical protein